CASSGRRRCGRSRARRPRPVPRQVRKSPEAAIRTTGNAAAAGPAPSNPLRLSPAAGVFRSWGWPLGKGPPGIPVEGKFALISGGSAESSVEFGVNSLQFGLLVMQLQIAVSSNPARRLRLVASRFRHGRNASHLLPELVAVFVCLLNALCQ